jgi:hypothetical protein
MAKQREWKDLSRDEKLASILYPGQVSDQRRAEMQSLAANEKKRSPQQALADRRNASGKAKS